MYKVEGKCGTYAESGLLESACEIGPSIVSDFVKA